MADTVRYLMEAMVPELEDLEARGFFSRSELAAVVRQRESHEYAFKRLAPRLSDYLRAVEYEQRLERLRLARRRARGLAGKKTLADSCIPRRIHFIYRRACRRFRGQLGVWAAWLRFCAATGAGRQASRVARAALALHPRCAALWAHAAAGELDAAGGGDARAARALMQQGLRACAADGPAARALWAEYFRLELVAAARLRARRQLLGIDDDGLVHRFGGGKAAEGVSDPGTASSDEENDGEPGTNHPDADAALAEILRGGVALVVLRAALHEFPDDVDLRARFLAVLHSQPEFPGRSDIEEEIYAGLATDFPEQPAAWALRAERAAREAGGTEGIPTPAAVESLAAVFWEGLKAAPSTGMVVAFLTSLQGQLSECRRVGAAAAEQAVVEAGERLCAWATERALADGRVALAHVALTLRSGELRRAAELAHEASRTGLVLERSGKEAAAHLAQEDALLQSAVAEVALSLEACCEAAAPGLAATAAETSGSSDSDDGDSTCREPSSSLARATLHALHAHPRSEALWLQAVQAAATAPELLVRLPAELAAVIAAGARGPSSGGLGAAAGELVRTMRLVTGLEAARRGYKLLSGACSPGGDFWRVIVDMEVEALLAGAPGALGRAKVVQLFEAAVDAHGTEDEDLWLRYMEFAARQLSGSGQVYWKAVKALACPDGFIATCQQLRLVA